MGGIVSNSIVPTVNTKQTPNLVNWIVVDRAAGRVRIGPRGVCKLWRVGDDRLGLPRRLLPPDPSYERHGRGGFRLCQQRWPDEVLEFLREVCMTQEYVGPKRTSMIRVDHHRTPVLSQHQLGRGRTVLETHQVRSGASLDPFGDGKLKV